MLAELAESVDAKTKLDLAKITLVTTSHTVSPSRRKAGSATSFVSSDGSAEGERGRGYPAQILEEKKREQEVQQQRLSTPWEGQ